LHYGGQSSLQYYDNQSEEGYQSNTSNLDMNPHLCWGGKGGNNNQIGPIKAVGREIKVGLIKAVGDQNSKLGQSKWTRKLLKWGQSNWEGQRRQRS
jgi:hypothetical protein